MTEQYIPGKNAQNVHGLTKTNDRKTRRITVWQFRLRGSRADWTDCFPRTKPDAFYLQCEYRKVRRYEAR